MSAGINRGLGCRTWSWPAFLLVALPCQRGFELCFLAWRHEERVFLRVLDNFFSHYLPLKTAQRALYRLSGIHVNYCHLVLQFLILFPLAMWKSYLTCGQGKWSSKGVICDQQQTSAGALKILSGARTVSNRAHAKTPRNNPASRGRIHSAECLHGHDRLFALPAETLNLNRLITVTGLDLLLFQDHFLIKLSHHDLFFMSGLRSFHHRLVRSG